MNPRSEALEMHTVFGSGGTTHFVSGFSTQRSTDSETFWPHICPCAGW
jgi:hypothetical protein